MVKSSLDILQQHAATFLVFFIRVIISKRFMDLQSMQKYANRLLGHSNNNRQSTKHKKLKKFVFLLKFY